jgi:hypothetical protein
MAFSIMSGIAHMSFGDRHIGGECRRAGGESAPANALPF